MPDILGKEQPPRLKPNYSCYSSLIPSLHDGKCYSDHVFTYSWPSNHGICEHPWLITAFKDLMSTLFYFDWILQIRREQRCKNVAVHSIAKQRESLFMTLVSLLKILPSKLMHASDNKYGLKSFIELSI